MTAVGPPSSRHITHQTQHTGCLMNNVRLPARSSARNTSTVTKENKTWRNGQTYTMSNIQSLMHASRIVP